MHENKKPVSLSSPDGLFIPNRQLSGVLTGLMIVLFCVFMGGYFVGKNHMIEPLVVRAEEGSFADQVYTSLYARYEPAVADVAPEAVVAEGADEVAAPPQPAAIVAGQTGWYAPLVGYADGAVAERFAQKLGKKGIGVQVKKYPSRSATGSKKKYWYQVVTDTYTDRDMLKAVVDKVAKEEKLKNVDIKEIKL